MDFKQEYGEEIKILKIIVFFRRMLRVACIIVR